MSRLLGVYKNNKSLILAGIILGILSPIIGIFLGLQVSATLATIFALPFVTMVVITGIPIGYWSLSLFILGSLLSIVIWIGILFILRYIHKTIRGT